MQIVHRKLARIALYTTLTLVAVATTRLYLAEITPIRTTGADVADAAQVGDVVFAMTKSHRLLDLLKQADWDVSQIPPEAMQLPDRRLSEDRAFRDDMASSFIIPHQRAYGPIPSSDAKHDDLAFYSSIYVRQNTSYYKGDIARSKPSGFYIVGLKNGTVSQVSVADARLVKGETHKIAIAFPGMKAYDPNAPKLPFVEFADGPGSRKHQAAYANLIAGECAGCAK